MTARVQTPLAMTRRITRVFDAATPEQLEKGLTWYDAAHSIAEGLADMYDLTLEQASAVIAALSPQISWALNVKLATRACWNHGLTGGALGANVEKANRILSGEKVSDVLGTAESKSGHKVRAFFQSILTSGRATNVSSVCIDRHAQAIAEGTRDTRYLTPKRYLEIAQAYVDAAHVINRRKHGNLPPVTPAQVQAVTWVVWRAQHGVAAAHG